MFRTTRCIGTVLDTPSGFFFKPPKRAFASTQAIKGSDNLKGQVKETVNREFPMSALMRDLIRVPARIPNWVRGRFREGSGEDSESEFAKGLRVG